MPAFVWKGSGMREPTVRIRMILRTGTTLMVASLLRFGCAAVALIGLLVAGAAQGQGAPLAKSFEPVVGQAGKDVVWVPTPQAVVDLMLDLAKLTPQDYVIDLGSGDGRVVVSAARRGARAFGVELNADLVQLASNWAKQEGVADRAQFHVRDLFETDIAQASVLTMYLLPHLNLRLRPTILSVLKPGSRVVSHAFHMGDWQPDAVRSLGGRTLHLWIVPAPVMGLWRWQSSSIGIDRAYAMQVAQSFQELSATAKSTTGNVAIRDMRLVGDRIGFTLTEEHGSSMVQTAYEGRIEADSIAGTARINGDPTAHRWVAKRLSGGAAIERRN
jgi:SAM-dependent methyltransferase